MAAYAALVSLMHSIEQIEHHPRPPISLDKTLVQSLTEKITFLQEFLEGYSHVGYCKEADELEMRIADAAYAAEDVIESHIVDHIHPGSISLLKKLRSFNCVRGRQKVKSCELYKGLKKVIQNMDLIKREAMEKTKVQDLMPIKSTPASSVWSSSARQNITVGLDDVEIRVMDKLTGGRQDRQIIPIVGMGGSGKTTLARNVFQNPVVVQRFDILACVTISQEYRVKDLLLELLSQEGAENERQNECELGERLHKILCGRRYLIVLDDIWDINVWEQLRLYFPDSNNGSRIMLTTRLSNLANEVANCSVIKMGFLNKDNSWDLFCKIVFGDEGCLDEFEEIGKKIVKNCNGLPLAIVVVGGLLAKTERKLEDWERIRGNLSSALNSEDDGSCLKVLYISYTHLPVYLKPCFLYMGVFPEDSEIRVSTLVKLWVAEGFLKPIRGKSLELVAKEYLKDLIDRNLILVHRLGSMRNIKFCKIHDLLRDLCLREAQKERFYNVIGQYSLPQGSKRRFVVLKSTSKKISVVKTSSLVRSLIWNSEEKVPSLDYRLLRIFKANDSRYLRRYVLKFVNLRYISTGPYLDFKWASSVYILWNLQTLIFDGIWYLTAPYEIWNMPQLRHIECKDGLILQDPSSGCNGGQDDIVLVNLQKLMYVINFKCGEEMVKRISNIKTLKLRFFENDSLDYGLYNLDRLHKLESFYCAFPYGESNDLPKLTFPQSLKKLTLQSSEHWEDIMEKIGSLPLLEKLKLGGGSFRGNRWETVEGQFRSLKFLQIFRCENLEYWTTEYTHFPRLEDLVLLQLPDLKEIPSGIGEIPTLRSIEVMYCSNSAVISAREILREQEQFGNEDLQVEVTLDTLHHLSDEALKSLESTPNFHVKMHLNDVS